MKKSLFLIPVAALAFVACSNDEVVEQNTTQNQPKEIAFQAITQPSTRATAAIDGTTFPTDYNFFISAYAVDAAGDYFNKAEYTREGESGNTWSGKNASNKQYWPLSPETLNFLAVTKSDADGTNTTFGTATPNAYASKVVVVLGDNSSTQHDLMYSYARAAVTSSGTNGLSFNGGSNVAMAFEHAQAWVNFTVKAADPATAGAGIVVTGITLKGAVYQGTATVTIDNYNSKTVDLDPTLTWTYNTANAQNVPVPNNKTTFSDVAVNSTSEIAAGDGLMIVPNPNKTESVLDPSFSTFVVNYTLNGNAYTFEYTPSAAEKRMEPAHKYDFNITFTLHEIKVDATVTDWSDTDYSIAIPGV